MSIVTLAFVNEGKHKEVTVAKEHIKAVAKSVDEVHSKYILTIHTGEAIEVSFKTLADLNNVYDDLQKGLVKIDHSLEYLKAIREVKRSDLNTPLIMESAPFDIPEPEVKVDAPVKQKAKKSKTHAEE